MNVRISLPKGPVKIKKERFDEWVSSVRYDSEETSPSTVAKLAGISKSSFFFQRGKGYVEASVIIALSRALKLHPLDELLKFSEFQIFEDSTQPTEDELLSQVSPENLMEELLGRLRHESVEHYPQTMPEPYGLKRWLDTTALHGEYAKLAKEMGLASIQVLSKKINENKLTLEQLVSMCDFGRLNARFGLVVTGTMSWEEVGFPWNAREKALQEAPGQIIVNALMLSRRWLERDIQVKEIEAGVHRNLG